jgi:hypothetical protein
MKNWVNLCLKIFYICLLPFLLLPFLLIAIDSLENFANAWFLQNNTISAFNKESFDHTPKLAGGRSHLPHLKNVRHVRSKNEKIIVAYEFSTDAFGRRISIPPEFSKSTAAILFFGDSFTFGAGLDDAETIPSQFNKIPSKYIAYNYGVNGTSPRELYTLLKYRNLNSEVNHPIRIGVYTFIEDHFYRASPYFSGAFPKIELSKNELVESFEYGLLEQFFQRLFSSRILNNLPINWQKWFITEREFYKFCLLIQESKNMFQEKYPGSNFIILNFQVKDTDNTLTNKLKDCALEAKIPVIDSPSIENKTGDDFIPYDGHPTAIATKRNAEFIYQFIHNFAPQNHSPSLKPQEPK